MFHAAALTALALAVPSAPGESLGLHHMPLLLVLCGGIFLSTVFTGTSNSGTPLNMFPFLTVISASLAGALTASVLFALSAAMGTFFLQSRIGSVGMKGRRGAVELFSSVLLLCRFISLAGPIPEGLGVGGVPAGIAFLLILTVLSSLAMRVLPAPNDLKTRGLPSVLFNLVPVPMAVPVLASDGSPEALIIPVAGVVFWVALVQVGAFIVTIRRRALENSLQMERSLETLATKLSRAGTRVEVLRTMLQELLTGSGASRVQVSHGNLSMSLPVNPAPSNCRVTRSMEGLTATLDFPVIPLVSPERVDAFLTRTSVILEWISISETITREAWESIETLVLSMERTDRRAAGFSKQVAETASDLAEAMGFDSWSTHCLRIAALLHSGSEALTGSIEEGHPLWGDLKESGQMGLPPVTTDALKLHGEFWDGTGPLGLKGEEIPIGARVLSVCISWERAMAAGGPREAGRAMTMGRGTLHDPALTALLLKIKGATPAAPVNQL